MRVLVKSFGCSANTADGEVLKGCLVQAGHELACNMDEADAVVLNTCAVKGPTEDRMLELCRRVPLGKRLVVAGCLPTISLERLQREVNPDGAVGPSSGEKIVDVVRRVMAGERVIEVGRAGSGSQPLTLPHLRSNVAVSIVPIGQGCLGNCAYCCVVLARGKLRSYAVEEIADRVTRDLASGAREIWITSQDAACYGRDIGVNLARLLRALCSLAGDFRVRVGMMTPNMDDSVLDELVDAFRDPHVFKFVHLPVQSGDDQVLRKMRRPYRAGDFKRIVETFESAMPEMTVATDVICGFPGETGEAFEGTLRLLEEVRPDIVNVSKFFARPGTAAASMEKEFVSHAEIKRRSTLAAALARRISFEKNKRWSGWAGEVLVDERGKNAGSWVGRNFAYKPVVVKSADDLMGKTVHVRVTGTFPTYLGGELVE